MSNRRLLGGGGPSGPERSGGAAPALTRTWGGEADPSGLAGTPAKLGEFLGKSRRGTLMLELLGALACLSLMGGLVALAVSGVRQRTATESASARLEDAQNLLARWRSGGPTPDQPGWTAAVSADGGVEVLVLRAPGVHLSTLRVRP